MIRFRSLQSKLATLYGGMFATIALTVAVLVHFIIVAHAREAVRAEMLTSGIVYDRLWSLRAESLGNAAGVLARDFGFRSAVATGDRPTIASALVSLRERAEVPVAAVVDGNGRVTGNAGPLSWEIARLPGRLGPGQRETVVATPGGVYRLVVSPVMAPVEIGLVVFAVRLDGAEMRALERLSAIPLSATMIERNGAHWRATDGAPVASPALDRVMTDRGPRRLATVRTLLRLSSASARPGRARRRSWSAIGWTRQWRRTGRCSSGCWRSGWSGWRA